MATNSGPPAHDGDPADAIDEMVDHVLMLARSWPLWTGDPVTVDVEGEAPRVYAPHKVIRRVADHLLDHLAELEARVAGVATEPDRWHASSTTGPADLAFFSTDDFDEAHSRLIRLARIWRLRLAALSDAQLDTAPPGTWTLRQVAFHVAESRFYADSLGQVPGQSS